MLREQVEGPAQCILCGLMSSRHEGQYLIMYLLIRHGVALVLGIQQHGKHVSYVTVLRASLRNQLVDKVINCARAGLSLPILCEGKAALSFGQLAKEQFGI